MSHTCHARECTKVIPPKLFMCSKHWYMLPKDKQAAIWREYRPGQEARKDPTAAYLRVADEAIAWLWEKEQELAAKKAGLPPPIKKQGDLFE